MLNSSSLNAGWFLNFSKKKEKKIKLDESTDERVIFAEHFMNRLSLRCQSSKSTEFTKNLLFFSPFSVLSFENLSNSGSSLNASIPCTSLCNFRPLWCLQERLYYPLRVCLSCPRAELRSCRHITLNGPHNQFYLSFLIMNTAILSFTKYVP